MLVTFTSNTSGEILMFADIARHLLGIIGKECTARGVFTKEQLPEAIEKLQQAVAGDKSHGSPKIPSAGESEPSPEVGLSQRAHPLIELMQRTGEDDGFVMWQAASDFSA